METTVMKINMWVMLFVSLTLCGTAMGGVLASKTRIIFNSDEREKSLMLANTNPYPIILQTWVDQGEGSFETTDAPFLVLPPVRKMPAQGIEGIRILYNGQSLPTDKETVFLLNLYEIPMIKKQKDQEHYMSLAMNTQLKLFYRPKQIKKMLPESIVDQLEFKIIQDNDYLYLECNNLTPYHASLINLKLTSADLNIIVESEMDMMSYPYAKKRYTLIGKILPGIDYMFKFDLVDDQGEIHSFQKKLILNIL